MPEVFITDSLSILQQSFLVFPIYKFNYYPFIVTSSIPWERELVTSVCAIALRYSFGYTVPLSPDFFLNLLPSPLTCSSYSGQYPVHFSTSFFFSNEIWSATTVGLDIESDSFCPCSLDIWSDSFCKSTSPITCPFRYNIRAPPSLCYSKNVLQTKYLTVSIVLPCRVIVTYLIK